jgi:hypothetical protein
MMTHLDRDTLALVALGDAELSPDEREHLESCPGCRGELDALRRTVSIGRTAGSVDLVEPPDAVWARIHAGLGLSGAVAAPPRRTGGYGTAAVSGDAGLDAETPAAVAPVADLAERRRRRSWLPVAAAACAVGLVGGVVGGAWWQSTRDEEAAPVIAQAQLDPLPGWQATGTAVVEESADGSRKVLVDVADSVASAGLREVWLLTADASGLVSVGLLDGASGRFSIPAGIDLTEYPVVDVSAEPEDGNPAHSGDSIVRGTLRTL